MVLSKITKEYDVAPSTASQAQLAPFAGQLIAAFAEGLGITSVPPVATIEGLGVKSTTPLGSTDGLGETPASILAESVAISSARDLVDSRCVIIVYNPSPIAASSMMAIKKIRTTFGFFLFIASGEITTCSAMIY